MCVLIDTWWNVNKALNAALCITDRVLIDTWWNVNFSVTFVHFPDASVLIDTWWNVNELVIEHHNLDEDSFNRYMVECEYKCPAGVWTIGYGFNRYMVECE